jgi:hypothetical protein
MSAVRTDFLTDGTSAKRFLDAAVDLSTELTTVTAQAVTQVLARAIPGFRMRGINQSSSSSDTAGRSTPVCPTGTGPWPAAICLPHNNGSVLRGPTRSWVRPEAP